MVEAKREDWERDPFTLVEENGYFYARGAADDKAMAAVLADMLIRFKQEGYKPSAHGQAGADLRRGNRQRLQRRRWLAQNQRELIDAEFALNEGGGGDTDGKGKLVGQSIQAGEKIYQDYTLDATNPGGHSSRPGARQRDLRAVRRAGADPRARFPVEFNDTTRAFFEGRRDRARTRSARRWCALRGQPERRRRPRRSSTPTGLNSMLRTTCVATMSTAATRPTRCRSARRQRQLPHLPRHTPAEIRHELAQIIGDPGDHDQAGRARTSRSPSRPPLDPAHHRPDGEAVGRNMAGRAVVPAMATGATDGLFLSAVGIPTYGVPGMLGDPDGNGAHGLNERIEVDRSMSGATTCSTWSRSTRAERENGRPIGRPSRQRRLDSILG